MKLKASAINVGRCYTTRHGELRQVVSLEPKGEVVFDARKPLDGGGWTSARRYHASMEAFVREAVAEAPCP
jgi:hypothetical protein